MMSARPLLSVVDWQTLAALACVAAAALYIARRLWQVGRAPAASSCGDCGRASLNGIKAKPLVTLDSLTASAAHQRAASSSGRTRADQRR